MTSFISRYKTTDPAGSLEQIEKVSLRKPHLATSGDVAYNAARRWL